MIQKASLKNPHQTTAKKGISPWKGLILCMIIIIIPWVVYINLHPKQTNIPSTTESSATSLGQTTAGKVNQGTVASSSTVITTPLKTKTIIEPTKLNIDDLPVQGPIPTNGAKPVFGFEHKGTDAIFALACKYPKIYYQRFVGTLRKFGYTEDIVLAVSPIPQMKNGNNCG